MNKVLVNLLNPPSQISEGQVWRLEEHNIDVIITDTNTISFGAVRAMVVSRMTSITDDQDVLIQGNLNGIFPADRVAIRATEGPIPVSSLKYFIGTIPDKILFKIKKSRDKSFNYFPEQLSDIEKINELLEPLRFRAVALFEEYSKKKEQSTNKKVLTLHLPVKTLGTPYMPLAIAAADNKVLNDAAEFWRKERKQKETSIILENEPNFILRLSVIDGYVYFVAISKKDTVIKNISFKKDDIKIHPLEKNITLTNNSRQFTMIDRKDLKPGIWTVSYNLNGKNKEHKVMLEWTKN